MILCCVCVLYVVYDVAVNLAMLAATEPLFAECVHRFECTCRVHSGLHRNVRDAYLRVFRLSSVRFGIAERLACLIILNAHCVGYVCGVSRVLRPGLNQGPNYMSF